MTGRGSKPGRLMHLPFTTDAFFEVFAHYNVALWPLVILLWLAALGALVAILRAPGPRSSAVAASVLALLWLWGGVVYHAAYFTSINPAAWGFAAMFVVEAGLLARYGLIHRALTFGTAPPLPRAVGVALAVYALVYPGLTLLAGHSYPAVPTFGVPCPTGIFTVGVLLTSAHRPRAAVMVVPVLWALIGGSAAVVLGVITDYVLLACAAVLVVDAAAKSAADATTSSGSGAAPLSAPR